jgi:hypothetical protein
MTKCIPSFGFIGILLLGAPFSIGAADPWPLPDPAAREIPGGSEPLAAHPRTYPDPEGMKARSQRVIDGLRRNDLGQWRRGFFSGGDPGKYLPASAMARLLVDPEDEEARKYMNDDRSPGEQYHFAAVNWGRFLPLFGAALTPDAAERLDNAAARYAAYLQPGGTENHKTMWMTTANVLPWFTETGRLANRNKEDALRTAKEQLRSYVKGLFAAGQGEWDSGTYLMFNVNGMLNIYDFSEDPETRLLARAALDWFGAIYALKYRDGILSGPNQRGFYTRPAQSIADQTGWVWWGANGEIDDDTFRRWHYAMHAITSGWRPNEVLTNLARKDVPGLPIEALNTRPNYWYGQGLTPRPGQYLEILYLSPNFTLASLRNGGGSQITRWQLVATTPEGAVSFSGGHPRRSDHTGKRIDTGWGEGIGRGDQTVQAGATLVNLSRSDDQEDHLFSFLRYPPALEPVQAGDWWLWQAGETYVGVRPVAEKTTKETVEDRRDKEFPVLKFHGKNTAFILEAAEASAYPDLAAFGEALQEKTKLDTGKWDAEMALQLTTLAGEELTVRYGAEPSVAEATRNGKPIPVASADLPIYDSEFVRQTPGILQVHDGRQGWQIDFTGDLPVYSEWQPGT